MTRILTISAFALSALTLAVAAQPLAARTAAATATAAPTAEGSSQAKQPDTQKYCIDSTPDTGSRVARRVCKTRSEWASEGVDIPAKK